MQYLRRCRSKMSSVSYKENKICTYIGRKNRSLCHVYTVSHLHYINITIFPSVLLSDKILMLNDVQNVNYWFRYSGEIIYKRPMTNFERNSLLKKDIEWIRSNILNVNKNASPIQYPKM